jgi:sodium-dependent phosphate transporter
MPKLTQYNYVFAIGTFFALLDAYNNGASKYSPVLHPHPPY